jgi:hypothetical protein
LAASVCALRFILAGAAADICAQKRAEPVKASAAKDEKAKADAMRDEDRLLRDVILLCGDQNAIPTKEALPRLLAINNGPWRNYAGEGLTDMKIAALLAIYGVKPKQITQRAGKNLRGYLRRDLEKAVGRLA